MSHHNSHVHLAHERLHAYRVALALFREVERSAAELPRGYAELRDQIRRSAGATVRNIAEAASRSHAKDRSARFMVARAECAETIASAEMAHTLELIDDGTFAYLRRQGVRVISMLVGLIRANGGAWPS